MIFSHAVHETGSWMPQPGLNFRKRQPRLGIKGMLRGSAFTVAAGG
jgi:hypothetical protein